METFLKRSGIGAIVIITSPFWIAMFLLYVVFGTLMIILAPLRGLFGLFSSKKGTFKIKNHYDEEAERIIAESGPGNVSGPVNQVPTYMYTNNQPNNANNTNNNNYNNNYSNSNNYPTNPQQNYPNPNINNLPRNNNQNQQGYNQNQQNYNNNQPNNYDPNYPNDNGQQGGNY